MQWINAIKQPTRESDGPRQRGGELFLNKCRESGSKRFRLAARGLTTQQIADRLHIAPKTADHHIQHIYTKIGVSTRAAAALWATQHAMVS